MIKTYDELFYHVKRSSCLLDDILDNMKTQSLEKIEVNLTTIHFNFSNRIVTVQRKSDNPLIQFKSPDIEISFYDFEQLLHSM